MTVSDDAFQSEDERDDYFDSILDKYAQAAEEAYTARAYTKCIDLTIKISILYEKVHELKWSMEELCFALFFARSHNLPHEINRLYQRLIPLYDQQYAELLSEEGEEDNMAIAFNRIYKAGLCEKTGVSASIWQSSYKEAAERLIKEDIIDDPTFGNLLIAALCYEKVPDCSLIAQKIFTKGLEDFAIFREALNDIEVGFKLDDEFIKKWACDSKNLTWIEICYIKYNAFFTWSKLARLLATKTENHALFLEISNIEIENLEKFLYSPQFTSITHDEISPRIIGFYYLCIQSQIALLNHVDPSQVSKMQEKYNAIQQYLKLDLQKFYDELVTKDSVIKEAAEIYQGFSESSKDRSVNELLDIFSCGPGSGNDELFDNLFPPEILTHWWYLL